MRSTQNSLTLAGSKWAGIALDRVGVDLPAALSKGAWADYWQDVSRLHGCLAFILGDVLLYAAQNWGRDYAQLVIHENEEFAFMQECMTVCERVPRARRRPSLTYRHHREVANLEESRQLELLDCAENQNWSVTQLREAIRLQAQSTEDNDPPIRVSFNPKRWSLDFIRFTNNLDPAQLKPEQRTALVEELATVHRKLAQLLDALSTASR